MKRIIYTLSSSALLMAPFAHAQITSPGGGGGEFQELLKNILDFTNTVLIPFIIGIGFLVFVWGMFQYFIAGGANDDKKEKGKSLMIYATLGFVLIIVFWGIVNLLTSSLFSNSDITGPNNVPTVPNTIP
ncbi:MAG: hypothetical protein KBC62_00125 [Candidatus Pacebacteria bacterium]|nr:hypothetical protein [Candidatus Paceibacterota bacterium]MBP9842393.1 hypothetical protein [Candidatus Paceibacterota bacterium]